jgi:hypothetical protein
MQPLKRRLGLAALPASPGRRPPTRRLTEILGLGVSADLLVDGDGRVSASILGFAGPWRSRS